MGPAIRTSFIIMGALLVAGCSSAPAPSPSPSASAVSHPTATASPAPQPSELVFTSYSAGSSPVEHLTVLSLDGRVLSSFDAGRDDPGFQDTSNLDGDIGLSAGLLTSNQLLTGTQVQVTAWGVLDKTGTQRPLPPSLVPLLNEIGQSSTARIDPQLFVTASDTLYALQHQGSMAQLLAIDLTSGAVSTLLSFTPETGATYSLVQLQNMSADGSTLSLLVDGHGFDGNQPACPIALVVQPASGQHAYHCLPAAAGQQLIPVGHPSAFEPAVALSADGQWILLAGPSLSTVAFNTVTGQELTVDPAVGMLAGSNSVMFSPDGQHVALTGLTVSSPNNGQALKIASLSGGPEQTVWSTTDSSAQEVIPIGWTSAGTFAYAVGVSTTPGNFNQGAAQAYLFDPVSGQSTPIGKGDGQLAAVLY
jgi:hypothetical protein